MATENLLNRHHSHRVGEGWAVGGWGMPVPGTSESGQLLPRVGRPCHVPRLRLRYRVRVGDGSGQDLRVPTGAGNLKNWKSEKLTARSPTQNARISVYRISGFHPT